MWSLFTNLRSSFRTSLDLLCSIVCLHSSCSSFHSQYDFYLAFSFHCLMGCLEFADSSPSCHFSYVCLYMTHCWPFSFFPVHICKASLNCLVICHCRLHTMFSKQGSRDSCTSRHTYLSMWNGFRMWLLNVLKLLQRLLLNDEYW